MFNEGKFRLIRNISTISILFMATSLFAQMSGWSSNIVKGTSIAEYRFSYMSMNSMWAQLHFGFYQRAINDKSAWFGMLGLGLSSYEYISYDVNYETGEITERRVRKTSSSLLWGGGYIYELVEGAKTNEYGETELKSLSIGLYGLLFGFGMANFSFSAPYIGAIVELPIVDENVIAQGNLGLLILDGMHPGFGGDIIIRPFKNIPQIKFTLGGLLHKLGSSGDEEQEGMFQLNLGIIYTFKKF